MAWLKSGDRRPFSELIAVRGDMGRYFFGVRNIKKILETVDGEGSIEGDLRKRKRGIRGLYDRKFDRSAVRRKWGSHNDLSSGVSYGGVYFKKRATSQTSKIKKGLRR
jgi:hypothetical protein